ncbi:MAG: hypothetical protein LBF27_01830 [Sphingobacterium sp.]|nr:hypothetical protein [Sphingobacterium sp.]
MKEMQWSSSMVYSCLSIALFISALILPKIGKTIQSTNNFNILLYSGMVMALGLIVIGSTNTYLIFLTGWAIIGIAMAMGLYDSLFATIGKVFTGNAKKSILWITLISSLAPTISWALVDTIFQHFGWRYTCYLYAILLIVSIFPAHRFVFSKRENETWEVGQPMGVCHLEVFRSKMYLLLSVNFIIGAVINTMIVIHLFDILTHNQIDTVSIVHIVAFLGPSQAAARILELLIGKRTAIEMSMISAFTMLFGIVFIFGNTQIAIVGVMLFGIGNGMRSVLRGTLPLTIYGKDQYSLVIGKLGRMPLFAQAGAPFLSGFILQQFDMSIFLCLIFILGITNIVVVFLIKNNINQNNFSLLNIH